MKIEINNDSKLEISLWDIIEEAFRQANEEGVSQMIEYLAIQPQVRKVIIHRLAEEFSRMSYYEEIHKDRREFLSAIKEQELDFYCDGIASKVEELRRDNEDYWKLYHFCSQNNLFYTKLSNGENKYLSPPKRNEMDSEIRNKISTELRKIISDNIPQHNDTTEAIK
jgi:predicted metal-dependent phosphoesterase TrpH